MPNTIRLIIDTSELEGFSTSLGEALAKLQEGRTISTVLAKELQDSTDRAFQTETDPNTGKPWPAWSLRYAKRVGAKKHKMLQDKGMAGGGLRSTIQTEIKPSQASIGSNLRYARIHQLGGGDVVPGYPARPYLGLDEKSRGKVERKIGKLLIAAIKQ